jgi:hypothetical protein
VKKHPKGLDKELNGYIIFAGVPECRSAGVPVLSLGGGRLLIGDRLSFYGKMSKGP